MTVTVITLLKRREGMSREDFRAYYETCHRRIGERVLAGYATRYVRRYLTPLVGGGADQDFDVVMEIDFPDQGACSAFFASVAGDPETVEMIAKDEEVLFDRSRIRSFHVEEDASQMPLTA